MKNLLLFYERAKQAIEYKKIKWSTIRSKTEDLRYKLMCMKFQVSFKKRISKFL